MRISDWSSDVCSSDLDVVDAGVGGRVDLQQVDVAAGVDRQAGLALPARVGAGAALAVQALGEDPRNGGLADPAGAGEQVGVVHAARIECVGQRADHVLLPDQFGEKLGAPLARSEERRGGKERVSTCRSRWWAYK